MNGNSRDSIWPNAIGHTDLELVGARWSVLLDDQKPRSLVQDKVAEGRGFHTHTQKDQLKDSPAHLEHPGEV